MPAIDADFRQQLLGIPEVGDGLAGTLLVFIHRRSKDQLEVIIPHKRSALNVVHVPNDLDELSVFRPWLSRGHGPGLILSDGLSARRSRIHLPLFRLGKPLQSEDSAANQAKACEEFPEE